MSIWKRAHRKSFWKGGLFKNIVKRDWTMAMVYFYTLCDTQHWGPGLLKVRMRADMCNQGRGWLWELIQHCDIIWTMKDILVCFHIQIIFLTFNYRGGKQMGGLQTATITLATRFPAVRWATRHRPRVRIIIGLLLIWEENPANADCF